MGLFLRALLIWLLVLALPAQGAAAVTMAFCNPDHHGSGPGATASHDPSAAHEHRGHDSREIGHHEDGRSSERASAGSTVPEKFVHAEGHECSACASCCSAAAIPSTVLSVPVPEPTPAVFVAVVPTVEAFSADGPDRPPRSLLA